MISGDGQEDIRIFSWDIRRLSGLYQKIDIMSSGYLQDDIRRLSGLYQEIERRISED